MKKVLFPVFLTAILVAIDQFTKYLAKTKLVNNTIKIIDGVFELNYTENRGAAFGLLQGGKVFFIIITVIGLVAMVFAYIKLSKNRKFLPLQILDLFIISGAIGNFIDRVMNGYVVDFMYISLIDFPVFNMADIFVSWSAVIVLVLIIFKYKEEDFKLLGHES